MLAVVQQLTELQQVPGSGSGSYGADDEAPDPEELERLSGRVQMVRGAGRLEPCTAGARRHKCIGGTPLGAA